jgi:hypothetical protein
MSQVPKTAATSVRQLPEFGDTTNEEYCEHA